MFWSGKEKPLVLLTGRTGQVGSEIEKQLAPFVHLTAFDRREFDLEQPALLRGIIRRLRPSVIMNAAAYTAVDQAEAEPAKARAINTEAVRVLAEEAERIGALLVHYSTDYVFDGAKASPYVESDIPNPLNVYGTTKLAGEVAIRDSGCFHLILRTTWIYAATGKNFVRTIAKLAQQKPELSIVDDQRGAPTSAQELVRATLQVLAQASLPLRELYHMTAGGETTWFGLAREIVKELERRKRKTAVLKPIATAKYPAAAKRPLNSVLSNERLTNDFGVRLSHWSEGLRVTLTELDA
jgi:dTDP-4-dehydrorhamnose reductase